MYNHGAEEIMDVKKEVTVTGGRGSCGRTMGNLNPVRLDRRNVGFRPPVRHRFRNLYGNLVTLWVEGNIGRPRRPRPRPPTPVSLEERVKAIMAEAEARARGQEQKMSQQVVFPGVVADGPIKAEVFSEDEDESLDPDECIPSAPTPTPSSDKSMLRTALLPILNFNMELMEDYCPAALCTLFKECADIIFQNNWSTSQILGDPILSELETQKLITVMRRAYYRHPAGGVKWRKGEKERYFILYKEGLVVELTPRVVAIGRKRAVSQVLLRVKAKNN